MQTFYSKNNESVQKKTDSTVSTVLDNSSQGESLQRKADLANNAAQRAEAPHPNNTGMPDNLKAGIESLSGFSMDDVRVHYNSSKPATVQALAYTQGSDIHVAPGQEKHLPHEAWHVAQQMAGRVSPTTNINGMPVNDNAALEHEADVMGAKALMQRKKCCAENECNIGDSVTQRVVQMAGHAGAFLRPPDDAPYLLKIVGQKEYREYMNIFDSGRNGLGIFPFIYGLWDDNQWERQVRIDGVVVDFAPESSNDALGKKIVAIQKLNAVQVAGGRILDFKIGKKTASIRELVSNEYKSTPGAIIKKMKMNIVDLMTGSSKHGIRDSDNTGDIMGAVRILQRLRGRQRESFLTQCDTISDHIRDADTVYIASSILVGSDEFGNVVVKLIDLAHPVTSDTVGGEKFNEIREGMRGGIQHLKNLVEQVVLATEYNEAPATVHDDIIDV